MSVRRVVEASFAVLRCSVALAVVLASSSAVRADTADRVAQQRTRIAELHARLQAKRDQLQFETARESDLRRQLDETTTAMSAARDRVAQLQQQIDAGTARKAQDEAQLAAAEEALQLQRDAYDRRLVQMYEAPADSRLALLVGTTSLVDFTERWDDLRYVAQADQRAIRERDAARQAVDDALGALATTIADLESALDQRAQAESQLSALAQERGDLLAVADEQRTHVVADVAVLQEITAQEEAQLEALIRAQEEAAEGQRQAGGEPEQTPPGAGEMQWPVSGPITSPFGMRLNPFGGGNTEFHPGIDIAVAVGTSVAAVANGRVIIVGWVSGYGNYIAIDHGDDVSTGYGHLSQFYVSVGQDVQRGQAIGASGNTGRSTGPHLIFEVRRHGTPVDPTPFL
jgi:murein DD-endopeptidase MepM/ murein hydrolase activator NlpD